MTDDLDVTEPELFDSGAIVRELVDRGGLHEFIRQFWDTFVPSPFVDNWHVGAVCDYLEAVTLGQIKNLVINIPPSTSKTSIVSIAWPAWYWTLKPEAKFLVASFDHDLTLQSADLMMSILRSEKWGSAYPYVTLGGKTPARHMVRNTVGGFRFSTTPKGKATGRHVNVAIIDDPLKPDDVISGQKSALEAAQRWFDGTLPTRAVDPRTFARVLIMQRLHTDDLAGSCLSRGYESLILPMRQTRRTLWARDPRKEGELLWPERYPETKVRELEIELGREASAQLQQDPTPGTGGFIEEPWTRLEYIEPPKPGPGVSWCQSWDFSSKGTKESHSKVSGQLWCRCKGKDLGSVYEWLSTLEDRLKKIPGAATDRRVLRLPANETYFVLVDKVGGHWNFVASKAQFVTAQARPLWALGRVKLIELKANGPALVEEMKARFAGIKGIEPAGSKEERLMIHTPLFEAGQVVYPPGKGDQIREEHVKFPRFTWDDDVDTTTQALDRLTSSKLLYRENLAKIAAQFG